MLKARVTVTLKPGVLDPQGRAIQGALETMNVKSLRNVRVGKIIELEMEEKSPDTARAAIKKMCEALLANPVMENYKIDIEKA
ncbi:MAG: phosphoribosylformylglycinamidine synthase subunit PurS [Nitrospinae bacterium]|nr:phosphoribosylformylglycinamidine synthase subunit PurS [Nitrospinota bacterium]